jgi:signal transduction histidine kinase
LLLVISVFFLFRIYLKRKNKLLLDRERMNTEFEQTLLRSQLEIQEHTFNEISREIHDNIGQVLSLVRLNLNTVRAPEDLQKIELMDELLGKAIGDLRSLSHSLDADQVRNTGWVTAVQKLMTDLQKSGKFRTLVTIEERLPALGSEKPIILFRMIQETVNNIIRHAAADTIRLDATREPNGVTIRIRDNGKGFDATKKSTGLGIQNLRNRSKMIGATLEIQSDPGQGTEVIIAINTETNE